MASLYEMSAEMNELMELLESGEVDEQVIKDTFEGLEAEFEDKCESYAQVINTLNGNIAAIENEIERLEGRKKSVEQNIKRMKDYLQYSMVSANKPKIKTALFSFSVRNNAPKLVIDDEAKIPEEFIKIETISKVDKNAIKDWMKEQEQNANSFAHLETTQSLVIK